MADLNDFRKEFLSDNDYITAHTSGSTGVPKAICLSKSDMRRSARASNKFFGIGPESLLVCPLSVDYIAGKMMVVRALEAGCQLMQLPVSNDIILPENQMQIISLLPVVPSQLQSLLRYTDLSDRVRTLLIGGGAPKDSHCRALVSAGVKVYISYGMTETCSHVAIADGEDQDRIFNAMPGIFFSSETDGRLTVHAPDFSFDGLTVNDIVEIVDRYSFRLLGRSDNVINSAGLKLHPEALEHMYEPVLGTEAVYYVTGEPNEEWGNSVLLVVEGSGECAVEAMNKLRQSGISHKYLPKRAVAVSVIPRTDSGKIIRRRI